MAWASTAGFHHGIVEDDVAGGGQVQAGAGGAEAEQEHAGVGIVLEGIDDFLPVFGLAGEDVGGDLALRGTRSSSSSSICTNWLKTRTFWPSASSEFEQLEQGLGFARGGVVADEFGVAADLAQAGEGGQHVDLALVEALFGDGLHDLVAAAAQFGQIKFALFVAQLAIAALLDAVGQIFGDVLLEPAQKQRAQLGGEPAAGDALGGFGVFARAARRFRAKCSWLPR